MKGRTPKPSLLHELHGRPRDRAPPANEPKPVGDLTEPPAWMSEEQTASWRYAIEHAPPGLLKQIDRGALIVWVCAEATHREASIEQAKLGSLTIKAAVSGTLMQSPYLPIIHRHAMLMLKAGGELGFSPVSRPRIGVVPALPRLAPAKAAEGKSGGPTRSLDDFLAASPARAIN